MKSRPASNVDVFSQVRSGTIRDAYCGDDVTSDIWDSVNDIAELLPEPDTPHERRSFRLLSQELVFCMNFSSVIRQPALNEGYVLHLYLLPKIEYPSVRNVA